MDDKILTKAREAIEEHMQMIVRKNGNMTPPDVEILTKDLCALEIITRIENSGMEDEGFSESNSYRRGRSRTTGRFTSRDSHDGSGNSGGYYDGGGSGNSSRSYDGSGNSGYSGHSIHDRMIDQLERMMNDAQSDYERQQIREFIRKARES